MNPEYSAVAGCSRHPSQIFTGFCSSCLIERLSIAEPAERRSNNEVFMHDERKQEFAEAAPDVPRKSCNIRVRRTLLSLFQLDDKIGNECARNNCTGIDSLTSAIRYPECENGFGDRGFASDFAFLPDVSRNEPQIDRNGKIGNRSEIIHEIVETGSSGLNNVNAIPGSLKTIEPLESENLKEKGLWLGSRFSRRILRKTRTASKRNFRAPSELEERYSAGFRQSQLEMDPSIQHTCDHNCSSDSDKAVWEDPRHSWDGVMMVKSTSRPAFSGISEHRNTSVLPSRRKNLPEEVESASSTDIKNIRIGTTANANIVDPVGDTFHEETQQANVIPKFRRPHGCGKAWYRSFTSPWRDLLNKRDNLLHRSFSESWSNDRKAKNLECMKADVRGNFNATTMNSVEKQHNSKNKGIINGDVQGVQPDSQNKDFRLGRSRSLHYSSPGNVESGLLRFYLTPLRSSRRATRRKTSRSFTRGILRF